ncbi:DNA polymerase III subunit delta' [Pseudoramibacter faecis]|uniref:DNA polymerase III subunit delta' n=1 Tax=Pseudoramibacter faecis TaxID=3108534 RepID=UPI002E78DC9C|nr:DNA polymerase III subunit delta' [Pseudoramibacter sp. HA2172]
MGAMFEGIIGQERIKNLLTRAVQQDQISHAYLLTGPRGIGKTTLARAFAKAILCTAPAAQRPCGECASCRHVAAETHPDFLKVAPQEGAKNIKIVQVRQLLTAIAARTFDGGSRVCLIAQGETMTPEAQNALLKSLEEPEPGNVFIILAENGEKILPTIRSRCQRLTLDPLNDRQMRAVLEAAGCEAAQMDALVQGAQGCPGRALARWQGEAAEVLNHAAFEVICDILKGQLQTLFPFAEKIGKDTGAQAVIAALIRGLSEAQAAALTGRGASALSADAGQLMALASPTQIDGIREILFELGRRLTTNANPRIQWEAALLKISELQENQS